MDIITSECTYLTTNHLPYITHTIFSKIQYFRIDFVCLSAFLIYVFLLFLKTEFRICTTNTHIHSFFTKFSYKCRFSLFLTRSRNIMKSNKYKVCMFSYVFYYFVFHLLCDESGWLRFVNNLQAIYFIISITLLNATVILICSPLFYHQCRLLFFGFIPSNQNHQRNILQTEGKYK